MSFFEMSNTVIDVPTYGLDGLPIPKDVPRSGFRLATDYPGGAEEYFKNESDEYSTDDKKNLLIHHYRDQIRGLVGGIYSHRWTPDTAQQHVDSEVKRYRREIRHIAWIKEDDPEGIAYLNSQYMRVVIEHGDRETAA